LFERKQKNGSVANEQHNQVRCHRCPYASRNQHATESRNVSIAYRWAVFVSPQPTTNKT
jgi:hypothetical protein